MSTLCIQSTAKQVCSNQNKFFRFYPEKERKKLDKTFHKLEHLLEENKEKSPIQMYISSDPDENDQEDVEDQMQKELIEKDITENENKWHFFFKKNSN